MERHATKELHVRHDDGRVWSGGICVGSYGEVLASTADDWAMGIRPRDVLDLCGLEIIVIDDQLTEKK